MADHLGIHFPSEAEALRKDCEATRNWTVERRLRAAADLLAAAEALSRAGGMYEVQRQWQQAQEDEWQHRMKEFIQSHVRA